MDSEKKPVLSGELCAFEDISPFPSPPRVFLYSSYAPTLLAPLELKVKALSSRGKQLGSDVKSNILVTSVDDRCTTDCKTLTAVGMSREDPWTSPVPNQMLRLDLPNGPPWIQSGLTATCTVDRAGPFFNAQPLKTAFEPRPCQMPWKSPFDLSEKGSHPPLEMRPTNEYLNDRNHDSRFFPQTQTRWQNQGPFSWPELAMVPVPDGATTVPVNTTAGYLPNAPIGTSALAPAMYPLGPNSGIGFGHWPMPNGTMQLFVQANPPSPEPKERPESYAKVIYDALLEADSNVLTLQEIYDWIEQRTDKAKGGSSKGWKNSVRHNLTVNGVSKRTLRAARLVD